MAEGIEVRVAKDGSKSYRASVWSQRDERRIRETFPTLAAAKAWRQDALVALRQGRLRAGSDGPTLDDAARNWLDGARAGQVRNRSGDLYKPSAIRAYEQNLRIRVLPRLAGRRLADIRRVDLQRLVDDLVAEGHQPSTVMTSVLPLRAIYRRAVARGEVEGNPTRGLEMPAIRRSIRYVPSPEQAGRLLDALHGEDQALWATAIYAGLRRGELIALRWEDVNLAAGVIHVRRGWDQLEGEIAPKSREGRRNVPVPAPLRDLLLEHRMSTDNQRVFRSQSWVGGAIARAAKVWTAAGLAPITLHEGRHTYASFMIAAGVNAKALAAFMGHANIAITYDLYGHLFPGSEAEAASLLETFLARAAGGVTVPSVVPQGAKSLC